MPEYANPLDQNDEDGTSEAGNHALDDESVQGRGFLTRWCSGGDPEQAEETSTAVQAPANFHQAAAVYLLGGSTANYNGCVPENVARCTNAEMRTHWEAAEGKIGKKEKLVCHFTSLEFAGLILGVDSIGFRASTAGQGGGGFYVNAVGPHDLEWDQYQGGGFRARVGRELWGEKADTVLVGGAEEDKLDVIFFIKVHVSHINAAIKVPGRDVIRVIPPDVLTERHGYHWMPKEKIVKAFILKKGVAEIDIAGLEMKEEDMGVRACFLLGAIGLVILQVIALGTLLHGIYHPLCASQADCNSRPGYYCDHIISVGSLTSNSSDTGTGRCLSCAEIPEHGLVVPENLEREWREPQLLEAEAAILGANCFCPDPHRTRCGAGQDKPCHDGRIGVFCESEPGCWMEKRNGNSTCIIPATSASPDQICVSVTTTLYTKSYRTSSGQLARMWGRLEPNTDPADFCADEDNMREEFCDAAAHTGLADGGAISRKCKHPACRGCLEHSVFAWGYDGYRWLHPRFSAAGHLRTYSVGDIVAYSVAVLMVVFPVSDHLASIRATEHSAHQFAGDTHLAITLTTIVVWMSRVRYFLVTQFLVLIVPTSVQVHGFQAEKIFVHAIVAMFVLKLETELFQYVLSDYMRADVERFGRVQVSEMQAKRNQSSKNIAIGGLSVFAVIPTLYAVYTALQYTTEPAPFSARATSSFGNVNLIMMIPYLGCNITLWNAHAAGKGTHENLRGSISCRCNYAVDFVSWVAFCCFAWSLWIWLLTAPTMPSLGKATVVFGVMSFVSLLAQIILERRSKRI